MLALLMGPYAMIQLSNLLQPHRAVAANFVPGKFDLLRGTPGWKTLLYVLTSKLKPGKPVVLGLMTCFATALQISCEESAGDVRRNVWRFCLFFRSGGRLLSMTQQSLHFLLSPSCALTLSCTKCRAKVFSHFFSLFSIAVFFVPYSATVLQYRNKSLYLGERNVKAATRGVQYLWPHHPSVGHA